ncbi:MAG: aldehyde dehydrogenase family protein [Verrucomicrobiales bacterium]
MQIDEATRRAMAEVLEKVRGERAGEGWGEWRACRARLDRLERALREREEAILVALAADLGKPGLEAYVAEFYFVLQELRLLRRKGGKWRKTRRVGSPAYFFPARSELRREAFGVALIVAPWNYPLQLALGPLMNAVAAGNGVVLKPSELSPATNEVLREIVAEVFPDGGGVVVDGGAAEVQALIAAEPDFVFFTGSTEVGRKIAAGAAEVLAPCVLELGGKSPAVFGEEVKLEVAVRRLLAGKFFNGGQTCFAPDFVCVPASLREAFLAEVERLFAEVPWREEMARIVSEGHFRRLEGLLEGAEVLARQGGDERGKLRLAPRVVAADWASELMKEEIFGPLLPVIFYENEAELRRELAARPSPLALYLFSEDRAWVEEWLGLLRSGGVCVNDTMKQGASLTLPFGGVGESGYGRYRGRAGVEAFSYARALVRRGTWAPRALDFLPPYAPAFKWLRKFLR